MSIGPLAAAGEVVTEGQTDTQNHRPLLWIVTNIGRVAFPLHDEASLSKVVLYFLLKLF